MLTVLSIIGTILCLFTIPAATILGFLGLWIFGTTGAVIGVIIGLLMHNS